MSDLVAPTERPLRGPLRKRESRIWVRDPQNWYVEPLWTSARLWQVEKFDGRIFDPACGQGNIVTTAQAVGLDAFGSDVVDRGFPLLTQADFLTSGIRADNIVSNPPFGAIAEKFIRRALHLSERKTAMLLPATWIQGDARSRWLETTPLYRVHFITPRPSMPPGHVIAAGVKPGGGKVDYAWFVWLRGYEGRPHVHWLRREP